MSVLAVGTVGPAVGQEAGGPPPVQPRQPAETSAEETRGAEAKQLYSQQRYVEAARAFEALYGEFGDPKYLFNAAAAYEGAGQDAHAYVALRRFLDHPGLSAEDQARGEARLAPLRRRTNPLLLEIAPSPRPVGLELELRRTGVGPLRLDAEAIAALDRRGVIELRAEAGEWTVGVQAPGYLKLETPLKTSTEWRTLLRLEPVATEVAPGAALVAVTANFAPTEAVAAGIDVKLEGPRPQFKRVQSSAVSWELPPGDWTLDASAPGHRPARVSFVAGDRTAPLNVRLEPASGDRPTVVLLGSLGGGVFISGAIVAAITSRNFEKMSQNAPTPTVLEAHWRGYHHGTRLLGAGLGLGAGALLKSLELRMKHPRRAWLTALFSGTGLAALGFSLYKIPAHAYRDNFIATNWCENNDLKCDNLSSFLRQGGAADFIGGLGVGLVTAGAVGLVQLALKARKKLRHQARTKIAMNGLSLLF